MQSLLRLILQKSVLVYNDRENNSWFFSAGVTKKQRNERMYARTDVQTDERTSEPLNDEQDSSKVLWKDLEQDK